MGIRRSQEIGARARYFRRHPSAAAGQLPSDRDHRPERRRRPRAAYCVRRDLISRWDEDLARGIAAVKFPVCAFHIPMRGSREAGGHVPSVRFANDNAGLFPF